MSFPVLITDTVVIEYDNTIRIFEQTFTYRIPSDVDSDIIFLVFSPSTVLISLSPSTGENGN